MDFKSELQRIRSYQTADLTQKTFNALVLGNPGTGKTWSLSTAPTPLVIHSFDPGGSKSLREGIAKGTVFVDTRFESDELLQPTAFRAWEKEFLHLRREGFFNGVGTFVLDSLTMWLTSLQYTISNALDAKKRPNGPGTIAPGDYQVLTNTAADYIRMFLALPCHVIVLGHLSSEKDEVTGRIYNRVDCNPKLQRAITSLFDEVYVIQAEETSTGIKRQFLTASDGRYEARTRIGGGIFATREEANYCKLMLKAGLKIESANSASGIQGG